MVFIYQAEDGIRDYKVTGVQTCALPLPDGRQQITNTTRRAAIGQLEYHQDGLPPPLGGGGDYLCTGWLIDRNSLLTRSEERRVGKEGRSRWSLSDYIATVHSEIE